MSNCPLCWVAATTDPATGGSYCGNPNCRKGWIRAPEPEPPPQPVPEPAPEPAPAPRRRRRRRRARPERVSLEPYYAALAERGEPRQYDGPDALKTGEAAVRALAQTGAIAMVMADRCWRTIPELVAVLQAADPSRKYIDTSVSADLRNLRKPKYGAFTVDRRRRDGVTGLWEYRLAEPTT